MESNGSSIGFGLTDQRRAEERARQEAVARERAEQESARLASASQRAEPAPAVAKVPTRPNPAGIQWVDIPAGRFQMGSEDGDSNEKPVHWVEVKAFRMAATEVTVGQYRKCVEAEVCTEPATGWTCTWSSRPSGKEEHPINCVDWGQARTFSRWVGGDLPTEAQWEYAARGARGFKYAGSDDEGAVGWYAGNSGGSTHPVGKKLKNGYGLYDMSGNVWEWTLDEWHSSYRGAPSRAEAPWGSLPTCSQRCDNGSSRRVNRGGSWTYVAWLLRVAIRNVSDPAYRSRTLGFRPTGPIP